MVNVHTSCHYAMLCYAMLCNALQGAVPELSFLAKPRQPNGHDDQMVLVDPLRETSWIPLLLMGIHGMGLTMGLPTTMTITTTMALIATALVATALTSGPQHFMHVGCSSTT